MTQRESLYLDLVRGFAAFMVLLDHGSFVFDLPVPRLGHQAVVVFFVLSGYVIAHTVDQKEGTAGAYFAARLSRLWSVFVPAMALTIILDTIGRRYGLHPEVYAHVHSDHPIIRTVIPLLFLSESWISVQAFSNGVVWSLAIEFWYYVMFAAWTFIPMGRNRALALFLIAGFAGFKALLLLPIWLFGVALQRSSSIRRIDGKAGWPLCFLGLLFLVLVVAFKLYNPAIGMMRSLLPPWLMTQLAEARVFWLDWLLGLAVACHLLGMRSVIRRVPIEYLARPIRLLASVSFAMYLLHEPLFDFCRSWLPYQDGLLALALVVAAIALIGFPIERSRRSWRRMLGHTAWPMAVVGAMTGGKR